MLDGQRGELRITHERSGDLVSDLYALFPRTGSRTRPRQLGGWRSQEKQRADPREKRKRADREIGAPRKGTGLKTRHYTEKTGRLGGWRSQKDTIRPAPIGHVTDPLEIRATANLLA